VSWSVDASWAIDRPLCEAYLSPGAVGGNNKETTGAPCARRGGAFETRRKIMNWNGRDRTYIEFMTNPSQSLEVAIWGPESGRWPTTTPVRIPSSCPASGELSRDQWSQ
jgi:hypothetical protein